MSTPDERKLKQLLDSNNITVLNKFMAEHDLIFFFNTRLEEKKLSIFHKVVFSDISVTFYSILQAMLTKTANAPEKYSLKNLLSLTDADGNTPLHFAAYRGNIDIISELLKQGCDYKVKNNSGLTVMHMAAQGDKPNVLIYFKEKYKMPIDQEDYNGSTPLHWACFMSCENAVNFLLSWEDEIQINKVDHKGQTPLHIAIHSDRINIIKKLLNKGADCYIKDSNNKTVYDITKENDGLENIFRLLMDYKPISIFNKKFNSNSSLFKNYIFTFLSIICETICYFILVPYLHSYFVSGLYIILCFSLIISYFYMNSSDPGILISNYYMSWIDLVQNKVDLSDMCPYCKIHKVQYVKHCHVCGHCVENFDHHCHWIDNCIGEKNSTEFMLFLFILINNLINNLIISIIVFFISDSKKFDYLMDEDDEHAFILMGFLYVRKVKDILSLFICGISLFFLVPVCYVLYTQFLNKKERRLRKIVAKTY